MKILELLIKPTHQALDLQSESADTLVLCTFETESQFKYVRQILKSGNAGEGMGLGQMERATFEDHVTHMGARNPNIKAKIIEICGYKEFPPADALIWDGKLAVCMTRYHYKRVTEPLPAANDLEGMASYWLRHYNRGGKGSIEKFITDCKQFF